jgi:hypothetical protein
MVEPEVPKPDLIQPNQWYALTIAPDDMHQYFKSNDRPDRFKQYWKQILKKLETSSTVVAYMEPSHPKNNNLSRLHFHCFIKFSPTGVAKWYMHHYNKLADVSQVCLKPIDSMTKWKNYCTKNEYFIQNVLSPYYDIPYPFYGDPKILS